MGFKSRRGVPICPPELEGRDAHYKVILADPPWQFNDRGTRMAPSYSGKQRKQSHYETMSNADVCAMGSWVMSLGAPSSVLFLWAPGGFVIDGTVNSVARSWGYVPKQEWVWVKTDASGKPRLGGGHYARICTESLVLCARPGAAGLVQRRDLPNVFFSPRTRHSAKPDVSYHRIMDLFAGPYLELFARRQFSPQWDCWGNELS